MVIFAFVLLNLYSASHSSGGYSVALPLKEPIEQKNVLRREDVGRVVTHREVGRAFDM